MKKMTFRKNFIFLFTLGLIVSVFLLLIPNFSARADVSPVPSYQIIGSESRLGSGTNDDPSGLRFRLSISKTDFEKIGNTTTTYFLNEGVETGLLLLPKQLLGNNELTLELANNDARIDKFNTSRNWAPSPRYNEEMMHTGVYYYNLPKHYYGLEIAARGYISITDSETEEVSTYYTNEYISSLSQVAMLTYNESGNVTSQALMGGFLNNFAAIGVDADANVSLFNNVKEENGKITYYYDKSLIYRPEIEYKVSKIQASEPTLVIDILSDNVYALNLSLADGLTATSVRESNKVLRQLIIKGFNNDFSCETYQATEAEVFKGTAELDLYKHSMPDFTPNAGSYNYVFANHDNVNKDIVPVTAGETGNFRYLAITDNSYGEMFTFSSFNYCFNKAKYKFTLTTDSNFTFDLNLIRFLRMRMVEEGQQVGVNVRPEGYSEERDANGKIINDGGVLSPDGMFKTFTFIFDGYDEMINGSGGNYTQFICLYNLNNYQVDENNEIKPFDTLYIKSAKLARLTATDDPDYSDDLEYGWVNDHEDHNFDFVGSTINRSGEYLKTVSLSNSICVTEGKPAENDFVNNYTNVYGTGIVRFNNFYGSITGGETVTVEIYLNAQSFDQTLFRLCFFVDNVNFDPWQGFTVETNGNERIITSTLTLAQVSYVTIGFEYLGTADFDLKQVTLVNNDWAIYTKASTNVTSITEELSISFNPDLTGYHSVQRVANAGHVNNSYVHITSTTTNNLVFVLDNFTNFVTAGNTYLINVELYDITQDLYDCGDNIVSNDGRDIHIGLFVDDQPYTTGGAWLSLAQGNMNIVRDGSYLSVSGKITLPTLPEGRKFVHVALYFNNHEDLDVYVRSATILEENTGTLKKAVAISNQEFIDNTLKYLYAGSNLAKTSVYPADGVTKVNNSADGVKVEVGAEGGTFKLGCFDGMFTIGKQYKVEMYATFEGEHTAFVNSMYVGFFTTATPLSNFVQGIAPNQLSFNSVGNNSYIITGVITLTEFVSDYGDDIGSVGVYFANQAGTVYIKSVHISDLTDGFVYKADYAYNKLMLETNLGTAVSKLVDNGSYYTLTGPAAAHIRNFNGFFVKDNTYKVSAVVKMNASDLGNFHIGIYATNDTEGNFPYALQNKTLRDIGNGYYIVSGDAITLSETVMPNDSSIVVTTFSGIGFYLASETMTVDIKSVTVINETTGEKRECKTSTTYAPESSIFTVIGNTIKAQATAGLSDSQRTIFLNLKGAVLHESSQYSVIITCTRDLSVDNYWNPNNTFVLLNYAKVAKSINHVKTIYKNTTSTTQTVEFTFTFINPTATADMYTGIGIILAENGCIDLTIEGVDIIDLDDTRVQISLPTAPTTDFAVDFDNEKIILREDGANGIYYTYDNYRALRVDASENGTDLLLSFPQAITSNLTNGANYKLTIISTDLGRDVSLQYDNEVNVVDSCKVKRTYLRTVNFVEYYKYEIMFNLDTSKELKLMHLKIEVEIEQDGQKTTIYEQGKTAYILSYAFELYDTREVEQITEAKAETSTGYVSDFTNYAIDYQGNATWEKTEDTPFYYAKEDNLLHIELDRADNSFRFDLPKFEGGLNSLHEFTLIFKGYSKATIDVDQICLVQLDYTGTQNENTAEVRPIKLVEFNGRQSLTFNFHASASPNYLILFIREEYVDATLDFYLESIEFKCHGNVKDQFLGTGDYAQEGPQEIVRFDGNYIDMQAHGGEYSSFNYVDTQMTVLKDIVTDKDYLGELKIDKIAGSDDPATVELAGLDRFLYDTNTGNMQYKVVITGYITKQCASTLHITGYYSEDCGDYEIYEQAGYQDAKITDLGGGRVSIEFDFNSYFGEIKYEDAEGNILTKNVPANRLRFYLKGESDSFAMYVDGVTIQYRQTPTPQN